MPFNGDDGTDGTDLPPGTIDQTAVTRLSRDLRHAASDMSVDEARFLVDAYYQIQMKRISAEHQARKMSEAGEPAEIAAWLGTQSRVLEQQIRGALDRFSMAIPVGAWSRAQKGIGPVLASGLIAHIDITKAPTVGHIWSFAGVIPGQKWEKGQKRPWNSRLKVLLWKIGQSFTKVSGNEDAYYGQVYRERKRLEWERNLAGQFADQARASLEGRRFGADTDALIWYSGRLSALDAKEIMAMESAQRSAALKKRSGQEGSGVPMLPPARLDLRAQRYAYKLFLAHWHDVAYRDHFKAEPPVPYPIAHLGHAHRIAPPPGGPVGGA
jgi:hypothetical protein